MRVWIGSMAVAAAIAGGAAAQKPARKPAPAAAAASSAPAGDPVKGKAIYASDGCYQCHNYAANGGAAGARLAPHPIAFTEFAGYVRKPTGEMPPYTAKVLSDRDIADIYAFLLAVPAQPAPGSIAILKGQAR